jgi:hypothetical protein
MKKLLLASLSALTLLLLAPASACACSCLRISADTYFQSADTIFVGRARAPIPNIKTGASEQTLEVLHTLKGKPGTVWVRGDSNYMGAACGVSYTKGDVAIVLAHKGKVGLCAGNFGEALQLNDAEAWLPAAGGKDVVLEDAAVQLAVGKVLAPYKHKRPRFDVRVTRAIQLGDLVLLRGTYPKEGVAFDVLYDSSGPLMQNVVER